MSNAFPQQAMKSLKDQQLRHHFSSMNSFISIEIFQEKSNAHKCKEQGAQ